MKTNGSIVGAEVTRLIFFQNIPCDLTSFSKRDALTTLFVLAMVCFACSGYSQGTLAPLYLYTSGDGSITPYQSGQMLEVGQTYDITAVPDAGYEFSSWQPVDVFIMDQTNYNNGVPLPPVQSIVPSVVETNISGADLEFTMQNSAQVSSPGSDPDIVEAFGWQADFVAVPEPADATIFACGLAAMAVVRFRNRLWRRPFFAFCSKSFVTISRQGRLKGVDSRGNTHKMLILNALRYLFRVS